MDAFAKTAIAMKPKPHALACGLYHKGLIDEVKVWNRPLTAAELDQSGQQPSPVDVTGKLTTVWGAIKATY